MKISELKINGIKNPIGFSYEQLLCSWKVVDTSAKRQKKARIEVSVQPDFSDVVCTEEGVDLASNETKLDIELDPRTIYYWRVTVTGDNGESAVSDTAFFETGKMNEKWSGQWIGPVKKDIFHPLLRKSFVAGKKISSGRIYVCGLGMYEAYLNGVKIGEEYLAPFLNDYLEAFQYQTYDVTDLIREENDLEILLGKGWYMGVFGLNNKQNLFGNRMMAVAELHIVYEDGSHEVVATDKSWQYKGSDIEDSGIYYGETMNRLLWKEKQNPWRQVELVEAPGKLVERYSLPVVEKDLLSPDKILQTPAGEVVVDFGQNHAGFMEFESCFKSGTKIVIECGEVLQGGNFYHDNYRDARAAFTYVADGRSETVRPHFTYFGYRYLRITGWPGRLKKEDIRSKVIYSDLERTGFIETSDEKINRLYRNCLWSQKSNFIDLPTDCPQRSERLGWTGDAQVFSATASYNMDTRAFYRKFLTDLRSEQLRADGAIPNYIPSIGDFGVASVWGDAGTLIPMQMFHTFGNVKELEQYYPMMRDWVLYMYRKDEETGGKRLFLNGFQFGDWLALDGVTEQSFKGSTDDDYIGTVYYYESTRIVAATAGYLGYDEDAAKYQALAEEIKEKLLHEYFTPGGRLAQDTQAACIIALHFGIYRDKKKLISQFRERLKKDCYQIKCGFVGAPLLCITLCENQMADLAYHFLFNEGFPGWLHCVNLGATTIWERWNSLLSDGRCSQAGMNSFNHYAYGSVVEFFYAYIAGIRASEPGFRKAVIAPMPSMRFRYFNCVYNSVCGKYVSNWKIAEDGNFSLYVEIPFHCEAEVTLPRYNKSGMKGAEGLEISDDGKVNLGSGRYEFTYQPIKDFRLIYDENTRLDEVAWDEEVCAILKKQLPAAYKILISNDKENRNLTFGELKHMFFMGFEPEQVAAAEEKIFAIKRW